MPVVPTYEPDRVQLGGVTSAKARGTGADAFGGQIAEGLGAVSKGVGAVADFAASHAEMNAETSAKDLDMQFAAHERELLYDGPEALYRKEGRGVLLVRPTVEKSLEDKRRELEAKATDPLARKYFAEASGRRMTSALDGISRYAVKAERDDYVATSTARISTSADYAAAAWMDPAAQKAQIGTGLAEMQDAASRLGWSGEVYAVERKKFLTSVHSKAFAAMMQADPIVAREYLEEHTADMDFDTVTTLKAKANEYADMAGASAAVAAIEGSGAAGGGGPIPTTGGAGRVAAIVKAQGGSEAEVRMMLAMGMIESGFNQNARNGASQGAYQFHKDTFDRYAHAGESIDSFDDQTKVAFRMARATSAKLTKTLGRAPQAWELYLVHQQGDAGGPALLTAPRDMPAWQALAPAYKGNEAIAKKAIRGNGGTDASTVGDFLDLWQGKMARKLQSTAAPSPGSPTRVDSGALPDRAAFVAQAVALAPPGREKLYRQEAEARWSDLNTNKTAREQAANDAVQPFLRDPNVRSAAQIAQAAPQVWAGLSEQQKTALSDHFGSGGFPKESDPASYGAVFSMAASNPAAFKSANLLPLTSKLSASDYQEIVKLQFTMRKDTGDTTKVVSLERVNRVAPLVIPPSLGKKGPNVDAFKATFFRTVAQAEKLAGKPLDDAAIEQIGRRLSVDVAAGGGDKGKKTPLYRYTVQGDEALNYAQIPANIRTKLVAEGRARNGGKPPTKGQLVERFRTLRAMGRI